MSKAINLGRKPGDDIKIHTVSADKTYYPTLYLGDVDDSRLADLPDEGTCVIKYKIKRKEHREVTNGEEKPKKSCSIDMDVISIEPPAGKSKKNGDSDSGARKAFSDYFKDK